MCDIYIYIYTRERKRDKREGKKADIALRFCVPRMRIAARRAGAADLGQKWAESEGDYEGARGWADKKVNKDLGWFTNVGVWANAFITAFLFYRILERNLNNIYLLA